MELIELDREEDVIADRLELERIEQEVDHVENDGQAQPADG